MSEPEYKLTPGTRAICGLARDTMFTCKDYIQNAMYTLVKSGQFPKELKVFVATPAKPQLTALHEFESAWSLKQSEIKAIPVGLYIYTGDARWASHPVLLSLYVSTIRSSLDVTGGIDKVFDAARKDFVVGADQGYTHYTKRAIAALLKSGIDIFPKDPKVNYSEDAGYFTQHDNGIQWYGRNL